MKLESISTTVEIPKDVQTKVEKGTVTVSKGDKNVSRTFKSKLIELKKDNGTITIIVRPGNRKTNALMNTLSKHIKNMVEGVQSDYVYKLTIVYSHFPMNVQVKDNTMEISNFAGEKKTRVAKIVGQTKVQIKGKEIIISCPNKEHAGQTAANLEQGTKIVGKDRRVFQDGIYIIEKALKQGDEN